MAAYKEFQGRTLDEAIQEACDYYGVPREKLEIEIMNDAKSGIFGLVGVKKATIRAARVQLAGAILDEAAEKNETPQKPGPRASAKKAAPAVPPAPSQAAPQAQETPDRDKKPARAPQKRQERAPQKEAPRQDAPAQQERAPQQEAARQDTSAYQERAARQEAARQDAPAYQERAPRQDTPVRPMVRAADRPPMNLDPPREKKPPQPQEHASGDGQPRPSALPDTRPEGAAEARQNDYHDESRPSRPADTRHPRQPRNAAPKAAPHGDEADAHHDDREEMTELALDLHSEELVCETVCAVIAQLISPIVGEAPCTAAVAGGRVRVTVDCGEASGILVGREGQTLAAIQYLAARVVAKKLGGALRLQIDVGNYRERQDERLKELALQLAEKAKTTNRAQSTRPLSAYQRRIIHLALEGDEALQTHSKGEGIQRRVVIQLRRSGRQDSPDFTESDQDDMADQDDDDFSREENAQA